MVPRLPLLTFSDLDMRQPVPRPSRKPTFHDSEMPKKRWYHYLPLAGTVFFMLAPQPSWIYVLVDFHLLTRQQPITFALHLLVSYTLTIMAGSSLVFCVTRDPGTVSTPSLHSGAPRDDRDEEIDLRDALMDDDDNDNDGDDFLSPGRWCRKCWASKPERAHHCSICGRCVLKMDHHCPWLGHNCIGHRTYPAFVHFLFCITSLATYIAIVSIKALIYAFNNPFEVNEYTPVHELILSCAGVIFALVIGSFFLYHVYLISTNQTTLENINPFMILRYLPPLPRTGHSLSDPPLEPELSYKQRSLVRDAHGYIRMYDLGWKRNWSQVFGWNRRYGWVKRLWYGGSSPGNGKQYPRNPKSEELLTRLATELVKLDSTR